MADPWAGYNQGMQNLGQTFTDLAAMDQARKQQALEAQRQALLNRSLETQTREAERQAAMEEGLRNYLSSPLQGENRTVQEIPATMPINAGGLVNMTPQSIGGPSMGGNYNASQPMNMERATLDYYRKNDPARAMEVEKQMLGKFKSLADVDPNRAIEWYNSVSGMNLEYAGSDEKYHYTKTDDGKVIAVNKSNPRDVTVVNEGPSKADAQGELIDKRFENQMTLENIRQARQDARQLRQLAAMSGEGGGKPPAGYRWTPSGDLESIPGGPGDIKLAKEASANQGAVDSIDTAIESVQGLLNHPGRKAATGTTSILNRVAMPGTDRSGFLAKLDTFQSQMFVPMVSQLKGMGQLSDAEGRKLTQAVGAMNPNMPEKEFKASLENIMRELKQKRQRVLSRGRQQAAPAQQTPAQGKTGSQKDKPIDNLRSKYGIGQ